MRFYQHIIKVISITVIPPSDFGVLENVQAITQKITLKQHNTAVTMSSKSVHP